MRVYSTIVDSSRAQPNTCTHTLAHKSIFYHCHVLMSLGETHEIRATTTLNLSHPAYHPKGMKKKKI